MSNPWGPIWRSNQAFCFKTKMGPIDVGLVTLSISSDGNGGDDSSEVNANALLMNASPDLLSSCELALDWIKSTCQALGELTQEHDVVVWDRLESAIRKARGQ